MSYVFGKRFHPMGDTPGVQTIVKNDDGTTSVVEQPAGGAVAPASSSSSDVLSSITSGLSSIASSIVDVVNPANWLSSEPTPPTTTGQSAATPYYDPNTGTFVAQCPAGTAPNDAKFCRPPKAASSSISPVVPLVMLGAAGAIAYFALRKRKGRK